MATRSLLSFIRRVAASRAGDGIPDAQLLEHFVTRREEAAFEALVWRHGSLVLNVCGRLRLVTQDAEDVFQATFLALTRKAGSISNGESVASWLYKVAYRAALRVRARTARETALRQNKLARAESPPADKGLAPDVRAALDEEINRLPQKCRAAVILCYMQGKTTEEAARQIGCPRGTVCSRLSRARRCLRVRLARRGLALSTAALVTALAPSIAPAALIASTVRAAGLYVSGNTIGAALPGSAIALAEGVLRDMMRTKLKTVAAVVLVLGALCSGARLCTRLAFAGEPAGDGLPALVRGSGDGVVLPPQVLPKWGIRTAEVKPRAAARPWTLQFSGTLAIDPAQLTRVRCSFPTAEITEIGKFEGKDANRELRAGDRVRKGQLLAILRSAEVGLRKTELFDALVKLHLDQAIVDRVEKSREAVPENFIPTFRDNVLADRTAVERAEHSLLAMGIPSPDIEAVRKAAHQEAGHKPDTPEERAKRRTHWSLVELHAVDDGTIVERSLAKNEQVVDSSVTLFQIARLDRLKVLANVPERDLALLEALKPEQRRWEIRTAADARAAPGEFESIGYVIDPNQRTALVTGFVDNTKGGLWAGQSIRASVTLPSLAGELVLPAGALVEDGQQDFVFVQPDPEKLFFEQRRVDVVRRGQDVVHVRSRPSTQKERQGFQIVRPGERIVTAGAVELKAVLDDLKARDDR